MIRRRMHRCFQVFSTKLFKLQITHHFRLKLKSPVYKWGILTSLPPPPPPQHTELIHLSGLVPAFQKRGLVLCCATVSLLMEFWVHLNMPLSDHKDNLNHTPAMQIK